MSSIWVAKYSNLTLGLLRAVISWFQVASAVVSNHLSSMHLQHSSASCGWFNLIIFSISDLNSCTPRSLHLCATFDTTWLYKSFNNGRSLPIIYVCKTKTQWDTTRAKLTYCLRLCAPPCNSRDQGAKINDTLCTPSCDRGQDESQDSKSQAKKIR